MDRNKVAVSEARKMEPSNVVTDAACVNPSAYLSTDTNIDPEDVASRLTPEYEDSSQLASTSSDDFTQPASTHQDPSLYYDMSGKKILVIFNHYQYEKWREEKIPRQVIRSGTYKDVESLERTFKKLNFKVKTHTDLTYEEIKKYLTNLCKKNHRKTSCVAVAVMTHGLDTHLCAADILYPVTDITDITDLLRTAPSLAGKPKLFFIQACRAEHIRVQAQQNDKVNIPMGADCLLLYSTYEDHVSYRHTDHGSWLMQSLCKVLDTHHGSKHLVKTVTLINKTVAEKATGSRGQFKQMSVAEFDLKKFLMF